MGVYITKSTSSFGGFGSSGGITSTNLPFVNNPYVFWDFNELAQNFLKPNIHSIKFYFLLASFLSLIAALLTQNTAGIVFGVLSGLVMLWVNFCFGAISGKYTLLKYYLLIFACAILLVILARMIATDFVGMLFGGSVPYVKITFAILLFLVIYFLYFLYYRSLSLTTDERAFMWSFYVFVCAGIVIIAGIITGISQKDISIIDTFANISNFLYFLSSALFIFAVLRFRKIQ